MGSVGLGFIWFLRGGIMTFGFVIGFVFNLTVLSFGVVELLVRWVVVCLGVVVGMGWYRTDRGGCL